MWNCEQLAALTSQGARAHAAFRQFAYCSYLHEKVKQETAIILRARLMLSLICSQDRQHVLELLLNGLARLEYRG